MTANLERLDSKAQPCSRPTLVGLGVSTPLSIYTQREVIATMGISDAREQEIFLNGGIDRRALVLPPERANGERETEGHGALLQKHRKTAIQISSEAVGRALNDAGLSLGDVDFLCCVSSTGLLTPSLSAHIAQALSIRPGCARLDVVGMGCNAGLNGMAAVNGWLYANPDKTAVLICVEICSAAYSLGQGMGGSVVNSLFGDGCAAAIFRLSASTGANQGPTVLGFSSHLATEGMGLMGYDWLDLESRYSFHLSPDVPWLVGRQVSSAVDSILALHQLRATDIAHWIVHSGGRKVIDAVRTNLKLSRWDLRHTIGVLRDHGNLSSGAFLFSLRRLLDENVTQPDDLGIAVTMGPGTSVEAALLQW